MLAALLCLNAVVLLRDQDKSRAGSCVTATPATEPDKKPSTVLQALCAKNHVAYDAWRSSGRVLKKTDDVALIQTLADLDQYLGATLSNIRAYRAASMGNQPFRFDESLQRKVVEVDGQGNVVVRPDHTGVIKRYEPTHTLADESGYVYFVNIHLDREMIEYAALCDDRNLLLAFLRKDLNAKYRAR